MIKFNHIDPIVLAVKDIETTLRSIYLRDPDENLIEVANTL
jgi:hypothetical protein